MHIENLSGVSINVWMETYEDPDDPRLGYDDNLRSSPVRVLRSRVVLLFSLCSGVLDSPWRYQKSSLERRYLWIDGPGLTSSNRRVSANPRSPLQCSPKYLFIPRSSGVQCATSGVQLFPLREPGEQQSGRDCYCWRYLLLTLPMYRLSPQKDEEAATSEATIRKAPQHKSFQVHPIS